MGDTLALHRSRRNAFGDYQDQLLFLEPRSLFPDSLEEGMTIYGHALPAGCNADAPRDALYTISEIYPEHVVLDGNHPLAGIALRLQLKVCAIREATVDEVGVAPQVPGSFAYSLRHRQRITALNQTTGNPAPGPDPRLNSAISGD